MLESPSLEEREGEGLAFRFPFEGRRRDMRIAGGCPPSRYEGGGGGS